MRTKKNELNPANPARLCLHTITTKPWDLPTAVANYSEAGVSGITVWRDALGNLSPNAAGNLIRSHGLEVVSYCRGGFFPNINEADRKSSVEDNIRCIVEAAELGAPQVVLVCGADPDQSLEISRIQIEAGLRAILPMAEAYDIKLAIEPLHPMYADSRSAINTLKQANDLAETIDSPMVGVAVDVYHLWWDPELESEIARCGRNNNLFAYHVCDWKTPISDLLLDRGLMGEGCIDLKKIRSQVESAGFKGFIEVEIFSRHYWSQDQHEFLNQIIAAYQKYV